MGSSNLATIAKFDEIVKIGGCTLLLTAGVDRLSCQNPKPANSEAILFLIENYVHVIFLHGG